MELVVPVRAWAICLLSVSAYLWASFFRGTAIPTPVSHEILFIGFGKVLVLEEIELFVDSFFSQWQFCLLVSVTGCNYVKDFCHGITDYRTYFCCNRCISALLEEHPAVFSKWFINCNDIRCVEMTVLGLKAF